MRNKGFGGFLRALGRALLCLLFGLLCGALAMGAAAYVNQQTAFSWPVLLQAAETAWTAGLVPLFTAGLRNGLLTLLVRSAPLALLALGVSLAWQGGLLQLGGAGQYAFGAAAAMGCAALAGLPWYAALAAACLAGALWGALPGALRGFLRMPEAAGTALTAWLALYLLQTFSEALSWGQPALEDLSLLSLLLAGGLALAVWLTLKFTVPGLELRVLGESEKTARYAGVRTGRAVFLTLCLSGLLGGAAGGLDYLLGGVEQTPELSLALSGAGLYGLAAAALAGGHPMGAVCMAVVMAYLALGAEALDGWTMPPEAGELALAAALYCGGLLALRKGRGGKSA